MKLSRTLSIIAAIALLATASNAFGFESFFRYLGMGYGPGYHASGNCAPNCNPAQQHPEQVYPNMYHQQPMQIQPTIEKVQPESAVKQPIGYDPSARQHHNQQPDANRVSYHFSQPRRLPPVRSRRLVPTR